MLSSILIFLLILTILVVVHELGHFLTARKFGIEVEEFGIGIPPKVLTLGTYFGTTFTLNLLPIGGFVALKGEDSSDREPGSFAIAQPLEQIAVLFAGPAVNLVLGFLLFLVVYTFAGIPTEITTARIAAVATDSPAAQAQLPLNHEIVAITTDDGTRFSVSSRFDAQDKIASQQGKTIFLDLIGPCNGLSCQERLQTISVQVRTPEMLQNRPNEGLLGIVFETITPIWYPPLEHVKNAAVLGAKESTQLARSILEALRSLAVSTATRQPSDVPVAGPIGIVVEAKQQGWFQQGWPTLLIFTAVLSINLGVINLLPIPALDGGRIVLILLKRIFRFNFIEKIEPHLNYGGFIALLALIALISARDLWAVLGL